MRDGPSFATWVPVAVSATNRRCRAADPPLQGFRGASPIAPHVPSRLVETGLLPLPQQNARVPSPLPGPAELKLAAPPGC